MMSHRAAAETPHIRNKQRSVRKQQPGASILDWNPRIRGQKRLRQGPLASRTRDLGPKTWPRHHERVPVKPPLKRILLVEDDPDIQAVAGIALRTLGGFDLEVCGNGRAALERAPIWDPDLILLDVMMPGMDGPETLVALRHLDGFASRPVVFMTARAQPEELARYNTLGIAGIITKPFDPASLPAQVRAVWERDSAPAADQPKRR